MALKGERWMVEREFICFRCCAEFVAPISERPGGRDVAATEAGLEMAPRCLEGDDEDG